MEMRAMYGEEVEILPSALLQLEMEEIFEGPQLAWAPPGCAPGQNHFIPLCRFQSPPPPANGTAIASFTRRQQPLPGPPRQQQPLPTSPVGPVSSGMDEEEELLPSEPPEPLTILKVIHIKIRSSAKPRAHGIRSQSFKATVQRIN
ncbi:hypothetical protein AMECASPLE_008358 [Ameca splendens]|uniref:Uncharacterized protein n=1 Tax=Ameca splendens TaxID=208324 RepID=A0ABV1A7W6_9TELE